MEVIKRNGGIEKFHKDKVSKAIAAAFIGLGQKPDRDVCENVFDTLNGLDSDRIGVEEVQDIIWKELLRTHPDVAEEFTKYRAYRTRVREWVTTKEDFIRNYKKSYNTADATIDDNSNVACKNIGVLNNEIHKPDNVEVNRSIIVGKLRELYPDFDPKQYVRDLKSHIIYKHDESSIVGIAPYCVSVSMYPFLLNGIKDLGGLSASPKNLDSFCGIYINMVFALSSQFAGAAATPEFLLYFDYFARKKWGDDYWDNVDNLSSTYTSYSEGKEQTFHTSIRQQIHQYFQQVIYSINQPNGARGMQSAFVNFSYFDKAFFEGMFGDFVFPDGTRPQWSSLNWLQQEFMQWFNAERLKTILTFPVESFALVYKRNEEGDIEWVDKENADFVCKEYERGHSFFTYISDTVDSLSSCCRLRNSLTTKEFNFTNGNMGIMTGSKSVITLNLNRIVQYWKPEGGPLEDYITTILERVYKYHTAYNELLKDNLAAGLLTAYDAGFINLNRQYLTIGINGLNEAAEFLFGKGCCNPENWEYQDFCQRVFSTIKKQNQLHKTKELMFNTEMVPAESLAIKNYDWDKKDGLVVPEDRNLYTSYMFLPSDPQISVPDGIIMHGKDWVGDYLDGGSACHINLQEHLTAEQYTALLYVAAEQGCSYFTYNVPNSECLKCGYIAKRKIDTCPCCSSTNIAYYDRIIGYLTRISNWSEGRRQEQKTRIYK